jgi:Holliday junction resolvasome RuvABC endonuclease subunit
MTILAIDPGTTESGWCVYHPERGILGAGVKPNDLILDEIQHTPAEDLAIEMIASYGMAVGREVFETCVWIGRMVERFRAPANVRLVYRRDVKLHLCGSPRAKDQNIRQALIDLIGPQGTKKQPGPTYGVKSHAWAALGVAVTAAHQMKAAT